MRLLLDTHIWVWNHLGIDRISRPVRDALDDPANEMWLSPVSIWEALLLAERRRIDLEPDGPTWVRARLDAVPVREAAMTFDVARESRLIGLDSKDPADRFLVATALVFDLTLVTADRRLWRVKGLNVLRNR